MDSKLGSGQIPFQTAGRLLQELGERLVASSEVALVELIKNAYDADSPDCVVSFGEDETGPTLVVQDHGNGMTFDEFSTRWMTIATGNKLASRVSQKYQRRVTGQKGIGRFAVRFLGKRLGLNTVAWDDKRKCHTRLEVSFTWSRIDKAGQLNDAAVPYELFQVSDKTPTGTTLTIGDLKNAPDFALSSVVRTRVLQIVSPLSSLDPGRFKVNSGESTDDPGFRVVLPGDMNSTEGDFDLARDVLEQAWARLVIDHSGKNVTYRVTFHDGTSLNPLVLTAPKQISNGFVADIRYFPRRAGVFRGGNVDGRKAWEWVRSNSGIGIVDHGFRVRPYGFEEDDWLLLDYDASHNKRDWRTSMAQEAFPISRAVKEDPAVNPVLNLATTFQVIGAVFVESSPTAGAGDDELTPSMDREGFLNNAAFRAIVEMVRAGLEYLAKEDKDRLLREKEREARELTKKTRADLRVAIKEIENSPTLTKSDKTRLVSEYAKLASMVVEVEEYDREARRRLEVMSALGVVAGFMTHESTRLVASLSEAIDLLRRALPKQPGLRVTLEEVEKSYDAFSGYLDYTRTFVDSVQNGAVSAFKSRPQVLRVKKKFGAFADERGIAVECDVEADVEVPPMPVAIYSGVLLNLYTNALKAIIASKKSDLAARVVFRGWDTDALHTIEVLDTGVGIPDALKERIWDPLFTTTSRLNNPLGSGMGLGLSLVRELVRQIGGRITLVDAPAEFSTCFRVTFPRKKAK